MKAIAFREATITIGKDQPEYVPLPAHMTGDDQGRMVFCWQFSFWERIRLLFTGRLWHQVLTFDRALQPQLLSIEKPAMWSQEPPHG